MTKEQAMEVVEKIIGDLTAHVYISDRLVGILKDNSSHDLDSGLAKFRRDFEYNIEREKKRQELYVRHIDRIRDRIKELL